MRKILFLLLIMPGFLLANDSYECILGSITYLPVSETISLNPKIIIEGSGYSQKQIQKFKTNPPYLETESGEKVMLQLEEINVGQMGITQGVFSTQENLNPDTDYFLNYETGDKSQKANPEKYNRELKEHQRIKWSTSTSAIEPLKKDLVITYTRDQVEFYGCGPEAYAVFEIKNSPDQEIWYRTELVNIKTGESRSYILNIWKDDLYVGHGMCGGAFLYDETGDYEVRFTPMNIDGQNLATTDWFTYESPYVGVENPWDMLFKQQ